MYLLDTANLGGMGGQKVDFSVAASGMSIHATPAAYTTAMGVHVVFAIDSGAQCPPGGSNGKAVDVGPDPAGSPPAPRVLWCAPMTGGEVDGADRDHHRRHQRRDRLVHEQQQADGRRRRHRRRVFTGTDTCTGVHRCTSPIAVKGRIVTSADNHLCSWSPH